MEKDSSETYPIQLEVHFVPRQEWGATIEGRGRSSGAPQNTQILWSSSLSRQTLIFGRFVLTSVLLEQYVGLCGYHDSLWIMTRSIDCAGSSGLYKQDTAIIKRQRNHAAIEAKKPIRMFILRAAVKQEMSQVVWSIFWIPSAAYFSSGLPGHVGHESGFVICHTAFINKNFI